MKNVYAEKMKNEAGERKCKNKSADELLVSPPESLILLLKEFAHFYHADKSLSKQCGKLALN